MWKGKEKITKNEYLDNEKSFLNETKSIFHHLWNASLWLKYTKIADKSFKLHMLRLQQFIYVLNGRLKNFNDEKIWKLIEKL